MADEAVVPVPDGADPYPGYAALRDDGPVRRAVLPDGLAVWLVTRYADVRRAFANPCLGNDPRLAASAFSDVRWRPENLHNMLRSDPPRHTRLRRPAASAFTARRVARLRPRIAATVDELLAALNGAAGAGTPADLIARYAFPLPVMVICELLGVPPRDRDKFRDWTGAILTYATDEQAVADIATARDGIKDYLVDLIAAKRRQPDDALVSALLAAQDTEGGRLDETELLSTVSLLLTAGHETTVNLISNGIFALLREPRERVAAWLAPEAIESTVEEMLRYDSPIVPGVMKFAAADTDIAGQRISRGDVVLLAIGASNRDPGRFHDPDVFDPGRAHAGAHLSFGSGIHFCIGAALARLEAQLAIPALWHRFPDLSLALPAEELRWRPSFIRGLVSLPVHLRP